MDLDSKAFNISKLHGQDEDDTISQTVEIFRIFRRER